MSSNRLWYKHPALVWEEALPIGNGRLGAMIFGGVDIERIQLNEDTLWSGYERDTTNPEALKHLDEVRKLIFDGHFKKAQDIIEDTMLGEWTEAYLPLGNLYIKSLESGAIDDYSRELDICRAVAVVNYKFPDKGIQYKRECFVSGAHNVFVMRITADKSESVSISAFFDSELRASIKAEDGGVIILSGKAPSHIRSKKDCMRNGKFLSPVIYDDTKASIEYGAIGKIIPTNGFCMQNNEKIEVYGADEVLIIVAAGTNFKENAEITPRLLSRINTALKLGFETLRRDSIKDYEHYYNRVTLDIDHEHNHMPTDQRLERVRNGGSDLGLEQLMFQFGRYLMISASRPGTQPSNLQGVWNHLVCAPWRSNMTMNINAQMNYWPTEICNLTECHGPFLEAICEICESGKKTAKVNFNAGGFTANHNCDIWRRTSPVSGSARWAYWPMAGGWICRHLFEHYEFNGDTDFLKNTAYPIMKEAAIFFTDWLVEDKEGHLTTCPSTSPENVFFDEEGNECAVSYGCTMDNGIISDLFESCIKVCEILGMDHEFKQELESILCKMLPFKVGKDGQLLEWIQEFKEVEVGHRHVSHLYALYPSNLISREKNSEFLGACRKSLEIRLANGGGHTGWSCAWIINLFARLKDGESAYIYIKTLLKSAYNNLFDKHPPFQIDGNFGYTAGIAEMLLQSHEGYVSLLPALPEAWGKGSFTGLCARGGFEISVTWADRKIIFAEVISKLGNKCKIIFNDGREFEFKTEKNKKYRLD